MWESSFSVGFPSDSLDSINIWLTATSTSYMVIYLYLASFQKRSEPSIPVITMVILFATRNCSAREDGGVSGVSSSCGARGGFLPRHDEDFKEPLVRPQGSQVSMRVAMGSTSWLSSHGRGLGPRDALKKDSRGLSRAAAGKPRFPHLLPGTLGNFPGCL